MDYINQIGPIYCQEVLQTKYNFYVSKEAVQVTINRLTNQIWKLIPMRENNEDWKTQLRTVIVEIAGINEVFQLKPEYIQILTNLEGLLVSDTEFYLYRKMVFSTLRLLQELVK